MSSANLRNNLGKIIEQRNLHIVDLERKAGLKKNSVYNIVKGISKNPSIKSVQAIAKALGVSSEKLCAEETNQSEFLNADKLNLITRMAVILAEEIKKAEIKITYQEYIEILSKIFEYDGLSNESEPRYRFAKWLLLNLRR